MKKKISTLKKYKLAGPVDPPESSAAEKFLNKTSSERKPIVSGVSFNPAKPSRTSSNNNTDFLKKIAGSGSSSSGSSNSKP